jgi:hypothetical protein
VLAREPLLDQGEQRPKPTAGVCAHGGVSGVFWTICY